MTLFSTERRRVTGPILDVYEQCQNANGRRNARDGAGPETHGTWDGSWPADAWNDSEQPRDVSWSSKSAPGGAWRPRPAEDARDEPAQPRDVPGTLQSTPGGAGWAGPAQDARDGSEQPRDVSRPPQSAPGPGRTRPAEDAGSSAWWTAAAAAAPGRPADHEHARPLSTEHCSPVSSHGATVSLVPATHGALAHVPPSHVATSKHVAASLSYASTFKYSNASTGQ